jgi:hypothetical protein
VPPNDAGPWPYATRLYRAHRWNRVRMKRGGIGSERASPGRPRSAPKGVQRPGFAALTTTSDYASTNTGGSWHFRKHAYTLNDGWSRFSSRSIVATPPTLAMHHGSRIARLRDWSSNHAAGRN